MIFNGTGDFLSVRDSKSQYIVNDNFFSRASSKFEGDYVRVTFFSSDFENGMQLMFVFDSCPACSVRQFSQYYQTVSGEYNMAVEREIKHRLLQ